MDPFENPQIPVTRFTMDRKLYTLPHDNPLPFGYRTEPWCAPMLPAFAAAFAVSYNDSPDIQVYPDIASREGCQELLSKLVSAENFLSGVSWLVFFDREPCAMLMASTDDNNETGKIDVIGVAPRHRRMRIGSILLVKALWGMRDRKMPRVMLHVNRDCRAAVQFFRGAGFQVTNSREYS